MCGRFTLRTPAAILKDFFGLPDLPGLTPRYNIAPTQPVGTVRAGAAGMEWVELRWGLVPSWADDLSIGGRMINARSETVAERRAFREAFEQRRCLVAADGFYEWQKREDGSKQPFYMTRANAEPFAFAGLWDRWRDRKTGTVVESCAVITTAPNSLLAPIHDRMPAILDRDGATEWLRPDAAPGTLDVLLQPFPADHMAAVPVSHHVNRSASDDSSCIAPVASAPISPRLF
jgi:putative SOS response-associated peptidase YedK